MPDRILIIHPSDVIRNGLLAACRELQETDVILFSGREVSILSKNKGVGVLIIDVSLPHSGDIISRIHKSPSFKTIGIYYPDSWPGRTGIFDREIHTNMAFEEIRDCVLDLLDRQSVSVPAGSGDHQLTTREKQVLKLLAMGHSHKEIGSILHISIHTVISHRKNITSKLGIKSVSGLAVFAIISGLIDTDKINPESLI